MLQEQNIGKYLSFLYYEDTPPPPLYAVKFIRFPPTPPPPPYTKKKKKSYNENTMKPATLFLSYDPKFLLKI